MSNNRVASITPPPPNFIRQHKFFLLAGAMIPLGLLGSVYTLIALIHPATLALIGAWVTNTFAIVGGIPTMATLTCVASALLGTGIGAILSKFRNPPYSHDPYTLPETNPGFLERQWKYLLAGTVTPPTLGFLVFLSLAFLKPAIYHSIATWAATTCAALGGIPFAITAASIVLGLAGFAIGGLIASVVNPDLDEKTRIKLTRTPSRKGSHVRSNRSPAIRNASPSPLSAPIPVLVPPGRPSLLGVHSHSLSDGSTHTDGDRITAVSAPLPTSSRQNN